jgi:hypothetical protein
VGHLQCPLCFIVLEVRDVTPCFICGGWSESVGQFNPADTFTRYRLPGDRCIVLCQRCVLEEFMVPGGWGYRILPGASFPVNALQRVQTVPMTQIGRDKFCTTCNLRLAFANVVADNQPRSHHCQDPNGG